MAVKNFVFANENQFTWRSGQNYTLSYYQLTFSESNRLIVSVIFAWLSIKAISISTKQKKNRSSMKQNKWTTSCTQNEAKHWRETFIWLESVTKKVTGNATTWRMRRRFAAVFPRPLACWYVMYTISRSHGFLGKVREKWRCRFVLKLTDTVLLEHLFKLRIVSRTSKEKIC